MSIENFTTFLINLPSHCKDNSKEGELVFTLPVAPHPCPSCHKPTTRVHDYRRQPIKTALSTEIGKQIVYRRRRCRCPDCGKVFSESHPFIAKHYSIPYSDAADIILSHARLVASSAIAARHNVSASTAARLFRMVSPSARTLDEAISIDEFRGHAGAKFQVVINSLSQRKCLAILPDRSPDSLYAAILQYPLEERLKVKYVGSDLSALFRKMVQECFPNAEIVADHFHAVRMANDALDSVRKEVQPGLGQECRKYFKHSRKVLLKRAKDLTEEERHIREVLLNHSDRLSAAYAMKEAYFKIFESKDGTEFSKRFRQFAEATEKQAIKGFRTLLRTTGRWKRELICGIASRLNNGFTEGCNTTIKTLKRVCYGFRNFENFRRRILFVLNDKERLLRRSRYLPDAICDRVGGGD